MSNKYTAHKWLERFYHHVLMYSDVGSVAKKYLMDRGINEETIKKFNLGYSPSDVKATLGFLKAKGFSFNDLVEEKVLIRYKSGKYKGKLTDPFRDRIIFPIQNYEGRTVAFGGRTLNSNNKIKYINSSESDVFIKSDNLYGFSTAKQKIKKEKYAVVFEGYFDFITAYQHGVKNAVATLGTALTKNQALLIKSITPNVVISFDGDDAGMESSFKSASILESVGCLVRIAHIDNELDPDEYIKKNGSIKFKKEVISQAKPPFDSFVEYEKKKHNLNCPNGRYSYVDEVLKRISANNTTEEKRALKTLGESLNMPLEVMYEQIKGV